MTNLKVIDSKEIDLMIIIELLIETENNNFIMKNDPNFKMSLIDKKLKSLYYHKIRAPFNNRLQNYQILREFNF